MMLIIVIAMPVTNQRQPISIISSGTAVTALSSQVMGTANAPNPTSRAFRWPKRSASRPALTVLTASEK